MRLQLVDSHTELGIIHHPRLFIQIQVESPDIFFRLRQTTLEQFSSTHNLHRSSAGSHKCQQRLRHHGSSLTDGNGLIMARQIVHLKEHQTGIGFTHFLTITVLHHRGKTDAWHLVGEIVSTPHAAIVLTLEFCVERDTHHLPHSLIVFTRLDQTDDFGEL